jgi:putative ABC transport system substrate-binding protein
MKRRECITLHGGTAAWPLAARAQQRERMRRIGVMASLAADDRVAQIRNGAFLQGPAAGRLERRAQRQHRISLGWDR